MRALVSAALTAIFRTSPLLPAASHLKALAPSASNAELDARCFVEAVSFCPRERQGVESNCEPGGKSLGVAHEQTSQAWCR
jgi:hypothetical protein